MCDPDATTFEWHELAECDRTVWLAFIDSMYKYKEDKVQLTGERMYRELSACVKIFAYEEYPDWNILAYCRKGYWYLFAQGFNEL